jgi:hypothetical protein
VARMFPTIVRLEEAPVFPIIVVVAGAVGKAHYVESSVKFVG